MNRDKLKDIAYFLGKSLGFLGLVFVFYKLSQEYTWSTFIEKFYLILEFLPALLLLNIASILVGIYAWHIMLLQYSKKQFPYIASYYYFTKTEISKYLPGNVFHFIGRQIFSSKIGISQVQMAQVSVLLSFLLLTGTIISSTFFAFLSNSIPSYILILMLLSSVISVISLLFLYVSFPIGKKAYMNMLLALSVAFQGIMLGLIVKYQSDYFTAELFFQCVSVYIISWLIGFITPGASGGLGVREATFIAIATYLHINISADIVIFSVLLVRLINIFVDIALYLSTFLLESKIKALKI